MRLVHLYVIPAVQFVLFPFTHEFLVFIGSGINIMLQEFALDPTYNRFGLLITAPFLICVSIVSDPPRASIFLFSFYSVLLSASRCQHLVLVSCRARVLLTEICLSPTDSIGPVAQFHENSTYYSAVKPLANKEVDSNLPHVTIEMPVYKESLKETMWVHQ